MVYRTSLTPLISLRREMDRLFDDSFGRGASAWSPAVDVREDPTEYIFDMELPGVSPENVEVTAEAGVLRVSGEKSNGQKESDQGRWRVVERTQGSFRRTFQLPENVDEARIEATFNNGVLTVKVPKSEVPTPRRIEVKQG